MAKDKEGEPLGGLPKFEPKGRDGSYDWATKDNAKREGKVKADYEKAFSQVKATLAKQTVRVTAQDGQLYLQWSSYVDWDNTPMASSRRVKKSLRQLTGANFPLTSESCQKALKVALELNERISTGKFSWLDYWQWLPEELQPKDAIAKTKTIGEWVDEFEKHYLANHDQTKYECYRTWKDHYDKYLKLLPRDGVPSEIAFKSAIEQKKANTPSRKACLIALKTFAKFCNINFDFDQYKSSIRSEKVKHREVTDQQIIDGYFAFKSTERYSGFGKSSWLVYRWMYGMMATYGFRNHEVLNIKNLTQSYYDPESGYTFPAFNDPSVDRKALFTTGKTGNRCQALPMYEEWIKLFNLTDIPELPSWENMGLSLVEVGKKRDKYINHQSRHMKLTCGLPFTPYDLRHAYAIRCRKNGINPLDAADFMGHSLEMHSEIYNSGISVQSLIENADKASQKIKQEKNELTTSLEKIERLEAENRWLHSEVEKLKLELRLIRELTDK